MEEIARELDREIAAAARPYLVAITGSVAVGKSTAARTLAELLARWRVDVVATDGFLFPNAVLEARGLMHRKGFPESYDHQALGRFLTALKAGQAPLHVPLYSHVLYDVLPDERQVVDRPDVLILEGLQSFHELADVSIYLDAGEEAIERWFLDRLQTLRTDERSFLRAYGEEEMLALAKEVWRTINLPNLREHIAPDRERATIVVEKGTGHEIRRILRR